MDATVQTNATSALRYAQKLNPNEKKRYYSKILDIDGVDPYEIPRQSWSAHPDDLPAVTYISIVNYFVFGTSAYTTEDFKAYKSLKAYRLFISGWVRDIWTCRPDGCQNIVVSAKVLHSQRLNEKALNPWFIASADGDIKSAHCTCMAGAGETCTHIGALAFAVDAFVATREKTTCTGVKAYWKVPQGMKGVTPKAAHEIDFSSAKSKKTRLENFIEDENAMSLSPTCQKQLPDVAEPSEAELTQLFQQLDMTKAKAPNILRVLPQYCAEYKVKDDGQIPVSLRALHRDDCVGKSAEELQEYCRSLEINISKEQTTKIEEATRQQSKSSIWFSMRAGRITASNLYAACHTPSDKPSTSLIRRICYPERNTFSSEATSWGFQHEEEAKKQYHLISKHNHTNFKMRNSGLHVPPEFPFMGASPDAVVSCDCHGIGCLEIKCPFSHRQNKIRQAVSDISFCLQERDGQLTLKENHPYFTQVQGQLFLTKSDYCDFVVWTNVDIAIVRIFPCQVLWDECIERAHKLFRLAILPELVGNWIDCPPSASTSNIPEKRPVEEDKQKPETDELFCFCREGEYGRMVACDNPDCPLEWFHFACVGLKSKPKGAWYCPDCAPQDSRQKKFKV